MPVINMVWPPPGPTANGYQLQHADIALGIAGVYFPWITEVSYDVKLEPGEARGTSPYPMGTTIGEAKFEASISVHRIYREQFFNLVENGAPGFMDRFFPIVASYWHLYASIEEADTFSARITGAGMDSKHGNDVLVTKFPLYTGFISLNGHVPTGGIPV